MILMIIPRITLFKVYITPLQHIPCFITWVVGKLVHKTTIAHLVIWQEKMADKRLLLYAQLRVNVLRPSKPVLPAGN